MERLIKKFANFFQGQYWIVRLFKKYPWASLATGITLVLILFISDDSLMNQLWLIREIQKEKENIKYYTDEIEKNKSVLEKLNTISEIERIAREKYLMGKKNEIIFLIEEETLTE